MNRTFVCGCGCGEAVKAACEYVAGHDKALRTEIERKMGHLTLLDLLVRAAEEFSYGRVRQRHFAARVDRIMLVSERVERIRQRAHEKGVATIDLMQELVDGHLDAWSEVAPLPPQLLTSRKIGLGQVVNRLTQGVAKAGSRERRIRKRKRMSSDLTSR